MNQENLKKIFLITLQNYVFALRAAVPGLTDRDCYHRLVEACVLTGHTDVFEKRHDGRDVIGNVGEGDKKIRVFTLYRDTVTNSYTVDLSIVGGFTPAEVEEIHMVLFQLLSVGIGLTLSQVIRGGDDKYQNLTGMVQLPITS